MLVPIELPDFSQLPPPSEEATRLIEEAYRRIDVFLNDRRGPIIENFVACDFPTVNGVIGWIVERQLAAGSCFCEWGCGFGVVAQLAALHGFDASGVEIEPELIDEARRLGDDLNLPAQFAQGSFIPEGGQRLIESLDDVAHLDIDNPAAYDELQLDPSDFDLIFAFPWPGETAFWDTIVDRYASDGAMFLTYHGIEDVRLLRKVPNR